MTDLRRVQAAVRETERAARAFVEFTERLSGDIGPAEMAEYDALMGREASAISERVEAFAELGLSVPSLDATGE